MTASNRVGSDGSSSFGGVIGPTVDGELVDVEAGVEVEAGVDVDVEVDDATVVAMIVDVVEIGRAVSVEVCAVAHDAHSTTVIHVCGRFTSLTPPEELAAIFATDEPSAALRAEFHPNYNVAPTTKIVAVANDTQGRRRLGRFHWGLVPNWAKDVSGSARLINARSETIFEKPSFRSSIVSRRCIVPVDGFFEWRTVYDAPRPPRAPREPVYATRRDGRPLAIAGLWASWRDPSGGENSPTLHSCCLVTTDANSTMAPIHDRMPVVLERDDWTTWLDTHDRNEIASLMVPAAADVLVVRDVATTVNSVRNNGPELLEPIVR